MIEKSEGEGKLSCLGYEVVRNDQLQRVTRLNVGCGHTRYLDCCNVDISSVVEPDVVFDFTKHPWPFQADTFSSVYCSHVLEHISEPLPFMEELARVCCHGAVAMFRLPYGSSDNAWEDPTHVRPYFLDSFGYFSQAAYGGADYGYKGDWTTIKRELTIRQDRGYEAFREDLEALLAIVMVQRNVVDEYKVIARNIKPPRSPAQAREASPISFQFQGEAQPAVSTTTPDAPPSHQGDKPS